MQPHSECGFERWAPFRHMPLQWSAKRPGDSLIDIGAAQRPLIVSRANNIELYVSRCFSGQEMGKPKLRRIARSTENDQAELSGKQLRCTFFTEKNYA
ncbi:unnamed protein product [Gongylonema pulchrum]|uniref:Sema domain-containing protein n=1 Tax=Gongylonema pulchrum TaxID=637853 RepID=A0A183DQH9_9BILA|nr:unnamed protein product [Gongylonema pulchrum]